MILYITEKPSQVQPLIKALRKNGISNFEVKPLLGHILSIKDFYEVDEDFKNRSWVELIRIGKAPFFYENPFSISYKKVSNKKFFNEIKPFIEKADEIILAPDPDNEGVTLALEVVEKCKALHKVKGMINMNKLDETSLSKEVKIINKIPFMKMYEAGQSRALFDMFFGFNTTIFATSYLAKQKQLLNIGAVKLPTIRMVVDRDLEFEKHKKIPYYVITAKAKYQDKVFDVKFNIDNLKAEEINKEKADFIIDSIRENNIFKVTKFEERIKKETPPKPYSLTDLQGEANKKFKLTAKQTLNLAQKLYETYKVQSYPRTDNNYYAEGEYLQAPIILNHLSSVAGYKKFIDRLDLNNLLKRNIFNDNKVTAHTALAPTIEAKLDKLSKLSEQEKKIFHLVAIRYIIQFYPDYEYLSITGNALNEDIIIANFGESIPQKLGFKEVTGGVENKSRTLPKFMIGDDFEILIDSIKVEEKFTKPKPRFTEKTLLEAMEKVYRFFDDEKIKEMLKDSGIGTPATRADILEDLKKKDKSGEAYFKVEKGKIISTQKARDLIAKLPESLSSPIIRAEIEQELKDIVDNKLDKEEFINYSISFIKKVCNEIANRGELREPIKEEIKETEFKCPLCNGKILENEKVFFCEDYKYNPKTKQSDGCKFVVFKNTKIYQISKGDFKKLLNGEILENEKLKFRLDLNELYFIKALEWKQRSNDELVETEKTYRLGDKYVFKDFRGKKLTKKQALDLLQGEEIILKLKSKTGNDYQLKCKSNGNGIIKGEFV